MRMIPTLAAAAAVVLIPFSVSAQGDAKDGKPGGAVAGSGGGASALFDRLDRNRDGGVSRDEADGAAELNTRFSELDVNNDNKLSRDELKALDRGGVLGTGPAPGAGAAGASKAPPK